MCHIIMQIVKESEARFSVIVFAEKIEVHLNSYTPSIFRLYQFLNNRTNERPDTDGAKQLDIGGTFLGRI
jgi:hypothetical protein